MRHLAIPTSTMCSVIASPTTRLLLATASCLSLLLAACGSTSNDPAVPVDKPVGVQIEAPRVTLVDAGSAPHTTLRYRDIDTGDHKVNVTITDAFTPTVGTAADTNDTPALEPQSPTTFTSALVTRTHKAENSETSSRSVTAELDHPKLAGDGAKDDLASAHGFTFGWFGNDAGTISSVNFTAPTAASDQTRALTEQFLTAMVGLPIVFPTEPVGVGGSWTVESRITGQTPLLQTITYTVTGMAGDKVDLKTSVNQRPTLGSLDMDDGAKLAVLSSKTVSEGSLTMDLTRPLPTAGSMALTTRIVYGTEDSEHRVIQDTSTKVAFDTQ